MPKQKQKGITFGYCDPNTGQRVYPAMTDLLPEQLPPPQSTSAAPDSDMYVNVTCVPPVGQATSVARDQDSVHFSVLLETSDRSLANDPDTKVAICHNHAGGDWAELLLAPTDEFDHVLFADAKNVTRRWYTGELTGKPHDCPIVSFTVKFQTGSSSGWKWIRDQTSLRDGTLHYQSSHNDLEFTNLFQGTSSDLDIRKVTAETADTKLYSVTASIKPASGKDSGYSKHDLGIPKDYSRWFALVRLWSPWLAPRHGSHKFSADKDAVLASFLRHDGAHVVCLAISGVDDVLTVFTADGSGNVVIQGRNDRETEGTSRVVVAIAASFEVANAAVMYHARKVVAGYESMSGELQAETKALMDKDCKAEWLEEWYDGFTYCTWNGLGQDLTEAKIHEALESLKKENIIITNLIIDDNWQSLTEGDSQFKKGWVEFEANKKGFPRGLKATCTDIRKAFPNIINIGVWHAILGYWGGIAKDGKIAKEYKTIAVEKEKGVAAGTFHVVAGEDAQRMYNDFYSFLSECGITSVKTDAQFFLDLILHAPDRRNLTTEYQDAWTIAHLRHFSSKAISCMSQSPQILFHSQLPTNKPRLLVRNSDDFFPEIPASHPWHIFCNANNSLLTQHLNVLPDWDMFQTSHPWAGFHAAARCVSGGPIYFTDYPGKHDIELIHQMTARTPRGKTVILRPHTVGKSLNPYVGYEEQVLLKVGTYVGYAKTGTSIVGIFNCVQRPLTEFVRLDEFPGTEEGSYVIRSFHSGRVSKPMHRGQKSALVALDVDVQGWEIFSAYPVREFETRKSGKVGVANLGLLGKMTGAAAVSGNDAYVEKEKGRLRLWTSLKALGTLGVYLSGAETRSIDDDVLVLLLGKPIPRDCVSWQQEPGGGVLRVDVEKAWDDSGAKAGWNNEVSLEIFVA
ncbi:hypothetical protein MBLNU459_g8147t1 [Dothideomycetes sp. NU459]